MQAIYFSFENVPLDKIDLVYDKMQTILENISKGDEKIDMIRMQNILERCILEYFSNLESNPHEALAFAAIADSLYGEHNDDVFISDRHEQHMPATELMNFCAFF